MVGAAQARRPKPEQLAAECLVTLAAAGALEDLGGSLSRARYERARAGADILVTMAQDIARIRALLDAALGAK